MQKKDEESPSKCNMLILFQLLIIMQICFICVVPMVVFYCDECQMLSL